MSGLSARYRKSPPALFLIWRSGVNAVLYHMQYAELTCLNEGPGLYPHLRALICCSALNGSSCCSSPIFFCFSFFSFVFPFVFCLFATRGVGNWEAASRLSSEIYIFFRNMDWALAQPATGPSAKLFFSVLASEQGPTGTRDSSHNRSRSHTAYHPPSYGPAFTISVI